MYFPPWAYQKWKRKPYTQIKGTRCWSVLEPLRSSCGAFGSAGLRSRQDRNTSRSSRGGGLVSYVKQHFVIPVQELLLSFRRLSRRR